MKVLVTGATGHLGAVAAEAPAMRGLPIRAVR